MVPFMNRYLFVFKRWNSGREINKETQQRAKRIKGSNIIGFFSFAMGCDFMFAGLAR